VVRAQALVNVAAIERNAARLRTVAEPAALCAVVKADGYGHGMVPAARAALAGGATWLAVATATEAGELRDGVGPTVPILVLGALSPPELAVALGADADVTVWSPELVEQLIALGSTGVRVHVKLDSGLGRLGTRDAGEATAAAEAVAAASGLELVGAWTHFATADEVGDEFFAQQLARFVAWAEPLRERHPGLLLHAANSAATFRDPASHFDLVRCGVALYGMDPFGVDPAARGLEPAMELRARVGAVKTAAPGESAGYGRLWSARRTTTIATVTIGYGDGWRRGLTNDADGLLHGRRVPLVGTISMDNTTFEVDRAEVGDEVTLIGARDGGRITAEEVARRLDTINYEITCGISARVPRIHHRDGEVLS
jgi:alanine racemase